MILRLANSRLALLTGTSLVWALLAAGCNRGGFVPGDAVPETGEKLPYARFLADTGDVVDLTQCAEGKRIVLVLLRGFPGYVCPYCTKQTAELVRAVDRLDALNAVVYVVYPGPSDKIRAFTKSVTRQLEERPDFSLPFRVLLDVDLAAVKAIGLVGDLAVPATFVLADDGTVLYRHIGRNKADRADIGTVLDFLKGHAAKSAP